MSSLKSLPGSGALQALAGLAASRQQGQQYQGPTEQQLAQRDDRQQQYALDLIKANQRAQMKAAQEQARLQREQFAAEQEELAKKDRDNQRIMALVEKKVRETAKYATKEQKDELERLGMSIHTLSSQIMTTTTAQSEWEEKAAGGQAKLATTLAERLMSANEAYNDATINGTNAFKQGYGEGVIDVNDPTLVEQTGGLLNRWGWGVAREVRTALEGMPGILDPEEARQQVEAWNRKMGPQFDQMVNAFDGQMWSGLKNYIAPEMTKEAGEAFNNLMRISLSNGVDPKFREALLQGADPGKANEYMETLINSGDPAAIQGFLRGVANSAQEQLNQLNMEQDPGKRDQQLAQRKVLEGLTAIDDQVKIASKNAPTPEQLQSMVGAYIVNIAEASNTDVSNEKELLNMITDLGYFDEKTVNEIYKATRKAASDLAEAKKFKKKLEEAEQQKADLVYQQETSSQKLKEAEADAASGALPEAMKWAYDQVLGEVNPAMKDESPLGLDSKTMKGLNEVVKGPNAGKPGSPPIGDVPVEQKKKPPQPRNLG